MDEIATPPSTAPRAAPEAIPAEKLATEYRWPGRLGTFDGWARFADCTMPPEPPARERARAAVNVGEFDLKRFMGLARGMGIPADDAARLAMNIVIEQRRANHPSAFRGGRAAAGPADATMPASRPRLHLVAPLPATEPSGAEAT